MNHLPKSNYSLTTSPIRLNDLSNGKPLLVLSEADWAFWQHNGYVLIPNAVPEQLVKDLADLLWKYENKDPNDPETWYRKTVPDMEMKALVNTGMVEIYQHQFLWNIRQWPKVHQAFTDIWGTEKLWVSIDRANMNFPVRPGYSYEPFIHWDYDPETKPQNVQGVLALNDQTDEEMGGFQCIPELFREFDTWKLKQPKDWHYFKPDVSDYTPTKVRMQAGTLLIFNSLLPHGIRLNKSKDKARLAQYISMGPSEEENDSLREWRINSWQNREPLVGHAFPGDPLEREKKFPVASLSELGEKLLGVEKW